MTRLIILFIVVQITMVTNCQIIADHTIVDQYDNIPAEYIAEIKRMWLSYPGESHALGVLKGLQLLEENNAVYSVDTKDYLEGGTPDPYTADNLRASTAMWGDWSNSSGWIYELGEEDWWTNATAIGRVKANLSYCNTNGPALSAIGFGWCWDATRETNVSPGIDPVTGNHWYGRSQNGPQGDLSWGLDDDDSIATGNSVNMNSYLEATQEFIDYCTANSIPTKVFFTTGPVDNFEGAISNESLYQGHLKFEYIRNYVKSKPAAILFDYADILCYNNDGDLATASWNGHTFPTIHPDNDMYHSTYYAHIGYAGTVRLAKAMWWMLARIAGWNGGGNTIPVKNDKIAFNIFQRSDKLIIKAENQSFDLDYCSMYSIQGNLLLHGKIVNDLIELDISSLTPGIYLIILKGLTEVTPLKVVIS